MSGPNLDDYVDVAQRIQDFKESFPDGTLRPLNPERPFWVEVIGEKTFVCYAAAAFRNPTDPAPGVGVAYEPFPGKSNFTRDSELQNAETSAWGRAIIAVLASTSKKIASKQEVRNRRADEEAAPAANDPAVVRAQIAAFAKERDWSLSSITTTYGEWTNGQGEIASAGVESLRSFFGDLASGKVTPV